MGEWDIPIVGAQPQPAVVDTGHAPIKFAIDWERKVLMMGVVVQDETGFHAGGFDLPWESAYSIGELLIKMALDLKDGGGTQPR